MFAFSLVLIFANLWRAHLERTNSSLKVRGRGTAVAIRHWRCAPAPNPRSLPTGGRGVLRARLHHAYLAAKRTEVFVHDGTSGWRIVRQLNSDDFGRPKAVSGALTLRRHLKDEIQVMHCCGANDACVMCHVSCTIEHGHRTDGTEQRPVVNA